MDDFLGFLSLVKWGLLACLFFALSAGLTSPFILLNRNALLPHALTHILLLPLLVISLLFPNLDEFFLIPLTVALTLILSLFIWFLERRLSIFEDSASAIVIHLSLALALVLAVKGSQYDYRLLSYLFGDILLATEQTFFISFVIFMSYASFLSKASIFASYISTWLGVSGNKHGKAKPYLFAFPLSSGCSWGKDPRGAPCFSLLQL
jgi:ABC-type Mn2+/Zn2+ transport system permease subunit